MHQLGIAGDAAIGHQQPQVPAAGRLHGIEDVAHLVGDRLDGGSCQLIQAGAAGEATDEATRLVVPVGCAEPDEGGHEVDALGAGGALSQRGHVSGALEADEIGQPLHRCAGDVDVALERVDGGVEAPGHGRGQAGIRGQLRRRGHHQRAAGAVGSLDGARLEAGMAEEGGVRIAHQRADGHARGQIPDGDGLAEACAGRPDLGQRGHGDVEGLGQPRIPGDGCEVHQLGARGVAGIGGVLGAAGQVPQQPAVDGAEADLAGRGSGTTIGRLVEQPAPLAGGEAGIERQPCARLDLRGVTGTAQSVAEVRGASALPRHHRAHGRTTITLPGHARLALVGDADAREGRSPGALEDLVDTLAHALPDGIGVLLHPARLGVLDVHRPRGLGHHRPNRVDEDGLGVAGALVDGQDQRFAGHGDSRIRVCRTSAGRLRCGSTGASARS